MEKKFAYFYFMVNDPEKIGSAVPGHIEYWKNLSPKGYAGGPFADRSGGMIIFDAPDLETAAKMVAKDPFVAEGALEKQWLKEWSVSG